MALEKSRPTRQKAVIRMICSRRMKRNNDTLSLFLIRNCYFLSSPLHKIKRLKLKKNQSDDEEDEKFLEKYSGTRRATVKKDMNESTDFRQIQQQLSSLTEKFKTIEETTDSLRNTISAQNVEIQKLMTELIQLRADEDKKFQTILAELVNPSRKTENLYEQQEQLLMKNLGAPESLAQLNAAHPGIENKNGGNLGWYSSDYYREFANGKDIMI